MLETCFSWGSIASRCRYLHQVLLHVGAALPVLMHDAMHMLRGVPPSTGMAESHTLVSPIFENLPIIGSRITKVPRTHATLS